jgi:hypothetical protein
VNYRKITAMLGVAFVLYFVVSQPAESWHLVAGVGAVFAEGFHDLQFIISGAVHGEDGVEHARLFNCAVLAVIIGVPILGVVGWTVAIRRIQLKGEK